MAQMTPSNSPTDDDLMSQLAAGDEGAFLALYRRRHPAIFRYVQHMSGNESIAEEVTQEVFMSLIRNPQSYNPKLGTATAYLYGVARNQLKKHVRSHREVVSLEDDSVDDVADTENGVLLDLTRAETIARVRSAVAELPEVYREAVVLCDLQEMSYQDAASLLSVPLGTVRSRLNRGRAALLRKLSPKGWRCTA